MSNIIKIGGVGGLRWKQKEGKGRSSLENFVGRRKKKAVRNVCEGHRTFYLLPSAPLLLTAVKRESDAGVRRFSFYQTLILRIYLKVQLNPAITDVKGLINFIYESRNNVV